MSPRFLWFLIGGASAAFWIHKHDEKRQWWDQQQQQQPDGSYPSWGHCMQHSWYWKHRRGQIEEQQHVAATPAANDDLNVGEASEQLVTAVRTGIRNVMDTLVSIETAFREEKAEAERRMRERPAQTAVPTSTERAAQQPVTRVDHEPSVTPPSASEKVPAYSPVPTSPQPSPRADDAAMSQILAALEKINAKLDK